MGLFDERRTSGKKEYIVEFDAGAPRGRMYFRAPCLRCGWTTGTAKISKREARALTGERRFTRLCDECIADLSGDRVRHLVGAPTLRHRLLATHRRRVA